MKKSRGAIGYVALLGTLLVIAILLIFVAPGSFKNPVIEVADHIAK